MEQTTVSKDNAEHYVWGEQCNGWHLVKSEKLSVIQETVPPGSFEVKHYHHHAEQFFYVLSGVASIEVDGNLQVLKPQMGIHVPAGAVHQVMNKGSEMLEILVTSTPKSHGDRVLVE